MTENRYMLSMIEVVNELQKQLAQFDITLGKQLPQIAVVGGQSAGKSSVLESFVGRDFLPRGKGIVTRRPLILQLKHNDIDDKTFARFDHLDQKVFTNFDEIREEISLETKRKIRDSLTGVSEEPITLTITSPAYVDLTLVDLPGMTKVPTQGQPEDIGQIIKQMILHYIREETCLILAVTPANADIATSDALELARSVDPDGLRTIGVLTKLDIVDKGTDAYDTLIGEGNIKLRRGFIGVVNRSQQNIDDNIDMKSALDNEKRFFTEHYKYRRIADRQGVMYLQHYLHNELNNHIKKELPKFRDMIQDKLNDVKIRLDGFEYLEDDLTREGLILSTLTKLRKYYKSEVGDDGAEVILSRDTGGVVINRIMNEQYSHELDRKLYDDEAIMKDLLQGVRNIFGAKKQIFFSNKAFFEVVKKEIEKFRGPTLQCVQNVTEELNVIVDMCTKKIDRFPRLILVYSAMTKEHVRQCNKKCRYMANEIIDTHEEYFNAIHDDFLAAIATNNIKSSHEIPLSKHLPDSIVGFLKNISNKLTGTVAVDSKTGTDTEIIVKDDGLEGQVSDIKDLVIAYVNIIKKTLKDVMPKTCQRYLVNGINNFMETDLGTKMLQNDDLITLDDLVKGDNMEEERQQLLEREQKLEIALNTINKHLFSNSLPAPSLPGIDSKKQSNHLDISDVDDDSALSS